MSARPPLAELQNPAEFIARHVGIAPSDEQQMLAAVGQPTLAALMDAIVPANIRRHTPLQLPPATTEVAALAELKAIASRNQVLKSFIGQGYYGTYTPGVVLRNILEGPAWYTAYTPYQAEISQGRMEALVNFQTMVCDLTGMEIANSSMLDEATSAAEAMTLARRSVRGKEDVMLVHGDTHPQTLEVMRTRATPLGITLQVTQNDAEWQAALAAGNYFAALIQYPASSGALRDWSADVATIHAHKALAIFAADLLALALLKTPGEMGADIVVGTSQRFGMPMCAGGPHAGYMACRDAYKRHLPGRLVGVSKDVHGAPAYRLALQTREQHIRREKATSNICTAQVLPAVVSSMYAVYHGPEGIRRIATRVARLTAVLAAGLEQLGLTLEHAGAAFDTLSVNTGVQTAAIADRAVAAGANLRRISATHLGIALDETTTADDVALLWRACAGNGAALPDFATLDASAPALIPAALQRTSAFMTHPVFHTHQSETSMLRYIRSLSDKDLALDRSMIPLGSCTMKLNATSEMIPITWPEFANMHPFAPAEQLAGYAELDRQLRSWLAAITGYADVSLQPNAGSQGEYSGLLAIRAYFQDHGQAQRDICLIPESAHGTNPASATMVGLKVVVVQCNAAGDVDMDDLRAKCTQYRDTLACMMITYPSTHGVFEPGIKGLCEIVHAAGGKVYLDGANMNAMVGLAAPGEFGGDVSHLNLHKTFCIPHGGGGPGVGPVCVAADLVPYLPGHHTGGHHSHVGAVSAAPLGNAGVLPISWMYIRMMGAAGLTRASEIAILNANYISRKLAPHYPTLYTSNGYVGHECILDLRGFKETSEVMAEDVAKRLIDYGFHAPTLSFPVVNTLMVEPTESEDLGEIDRFIAAMIAIREEIGRVEKGEWPRDDNPLKNAPHTANALLTDAWPHPYTRGMGAANAHRGQGGVKYWAPVGRVDNVYGDRHLFCTCVPLEAYAEAVDA